MTLQSSGSINFGNLQSEFGGANPISLSEYYRNAGLVDRTVTGVPTTGAISMSSFYGEANAVGLSIVTSKTGKESDGSIPMPTGIISGDIIIVGWRATWATIDSYTGSGFSRISSLGSTNGGYSDSGTILSYKVSNGSESGATIGGWTPNGGEYAIYVVRPSRTLRSISSVNTGAYAGTDNAPIFTITTASAPANATTVALAFMGAWSTTVKATFSPTTPNILDYNTGGSDPNNYIRLYMYIQNPVSVTPVNCVADYNNNNVNAYCTGYIKIT